MAVLHGVETIGVAFAGSQLTSAGLRVSKQVLLSHRHCLLPQRVERASDLVPLVDWSFLAVSGFWVRATAEPGQ